MQKYEIIEKNVVRSNVLTVIKNLLELVAHVVFTSCCLFFENWKYTRNPSVFAAVFGDTLAHNLGMIGLRTF